MGTKMGVTKIIGLLLIVAGALGLVYGGFSYTQHREEVKLGPLEFSVKERKQVDIPEWAGVAAIIAGGILLVVGPRKG
jgi:drug/metabolite transporter (DMT)-like permease